MACHPGPTSSGTAAASIAAAAGLIVAACGGAAPPGAHAPVVWDSAGVRIVESTAPAWTGVEAWRVEEAPVVRIGVVAGEREYQLHGVRAVDLLPDGGVVVLDGGSLELRRYDSGGRHLWSAGGAGGGPGEFRQPAYIGRRADGAFAVWDRAAARLTLIGGDGALLGTANLAAADGRTPIGHGVFGDDALLVTYPVSIAPPEAGAVWADTIRLWKYDARTGDRRRLAELPGPSWLWTGRFQLPVPFTANPPRAIAGAGVATAAGAAPEVRLYDDGGLAARYVVAREPEAVTPGAVAELLAAWVELGFYGAPAAVWAEWLDRMALPAHRPAFDRLLVDGAGHFWARRFVAEPILTEATTWDVFAPDGPYLGAVIAPPGLEVTAVGDGLVAGMARDSLDVEYVVVHRVVNP